MIYGVAYATRTMSGKLMESAKPELTRCGSCGQPIAKLGPCAWDESLMVGPCCEVYTEHRCPDCGSDALEFRLSEQGPLDEQTEIAVCHGCGHECDERDTRVTVGPARPEPKPAAPASLPWMPSRFSPTVARGSFACIGPGMYVRTGRAR